jgi:hypothetical protein
MKKLKLFEHFSDQSDQGELIDKAIEHFLTENLKVDVKVEGGDYGSSRHVVVKLLLGEKVIAEDSDMIG